MADDGWDVVDDGWDVAQPRDIRETAKRRLAALGGKPESEKGDFAPQPPPIAGNAIPAIEPVTSHAIGAAGQNPISSTLPGDLAGDGVRKYVPEEWYQAPKKDIRPEARRRYAALTDQVAPLEEGPETPKFIERHSRAMAARIPETSAAPSAGGRFLHALDETIGEQNPAGMKPSDMLKAPGELAEAINDYTDSAPLLPISKLAKYLPEDPTWIPGAPAIQALANTRFGRGAVRGSGVDVGEGPISYKQGIEAALKVPEGFSRAGDVATLGAMSLPVVGPAILAGMIPEQIGQAGADLGEIAGGLIGGDPEGAGMRLPGAATNAGMLALMGSHGLKAAEQGRMAEAAAKEAAAKAATERAAAPWYSQDFRAPDDVMVAARTPAGPRVYPDPFAAPWAPPSPGKLPPFPTSPEGRTMGPLPVPPDVTAQAGPMGWADPAAAPGGQHPAMRRYGPIDIQGENVPPPELQPRMGLSRKDARVLEQAAMVPEGKDQVYVPLAEPGPDLEAARQIIETSQPGTEVKRIRKQMGVSQEEARALYQQAIAPPDQPVPIRPPEQAPRPARGIGPRRPPAEENIQVEPKATTDAQLKMVDEGQGQPGKKPGVLYTVQGGAKPPDVVPEGLARVDGPAGTLIFDPSKVTPEQAREALTSGEGLDKALGFSGPRPEPHPDNAVVSVLGKDGVEKSSQVAGPGGVEGAVKAAQGMAGEGDKVAVRTPDEVIADRQAGIEAEKKPGRPTVPRSPQSISRRSAEKYILRDPLGGEEGSSIEVQVLRAKDGTIEAFVTDVGVIPASPRDRVLPAEEAIANTFGDAPPGAPADVSKVSRVGGADAGIEAEKKPPLDLKGVTAKVREHADGNVAAAGDSRVVTLRGDRGDAFVVHESANEPGAWQLTHLDKDGSPTGHRLFKSREDAIRSASGQVVRGDPSSVGSGYKVERRVEDKGPEGRLHFVDVGQIAQDYKLREMRKLNEALDVLSEKRRISNKEQADAEHRARIAERIAAEQAHAERGLGGGVPDGDAAGVGAPRAPEGMVSAPGPERGPAPEAPRAPEPGVRPAAEVASRRIPWRHSTDGMEVVPVEELKFDNGKWAQATGAPAGTKWTGEKRTVGYAWKNRDGITVGKRYATEAEAKAALAGAKAKAEIEAREYQEANPVPEPDLRTVTRGDLNELVADPSFPPGEARARAERPDEPVRYTHAEVQSEQLPVTREQRHAAGGRPIRGPVMKHVVLWGPDGQIVEKRPMGIGPLAVRRANKIVKELNERPAGGGILEQPEVPTVPERTNSDFVPERRAADEPRVRAAAAGAPPGGPRDRLVQEARSAGLGTPEQVEAVAQVWDARAKQWAKETGRSVGQFFQKFFGSVRKGGAPADALRQGEAPVFYSKLRRVVEGMKAPMTPDQLRGYLKAQGVKPEELEWTNLDSALEGRRLVRPQELLQHIDANQVKVKEILKGGGGAELSSAREALRTAADERERLFDEAHRIAEVRRQLDRGATARATEQLIASGMSKLDAMHAVDDFRYAMLDGVPYNGITASPEVAKAEAAYAQAVEDHRAATRRWREAKEKAEVLSGNLYKLQDSVPKFGEYQIPGGEGYRELLLQMDLPGAKKIAYTPTTPVEVRQEPGPGKWYMVQRDGEWRGTDASSGEEGFPSREAAESAMRAEQASRTVTGPGYQSPHWKEPDVLAHARFSSRDGGKTFHIEEIQSDIHQQARKRGYRAGPEPPGGWDDEVDPLPNAPFKKTWPELVFKRLLRYAAENGYERVTWTPGDVQAERYDLSKKINELYWEPQHVEGGSGRPSGRLQAWNQDGEQVMNSIVAEDKLPDHIGKELADRVIQKSNRRPEAGPLDVAMSGLDLKVGGEGMKGFYDKIIPSIADKLGKRFGAKVGEGTIEDGVRVHSLEITPAMRDSVMEGQPLFQGAKGAVSFMEDGKAVIHALSEPDVSTFLHESAHVFRRTLTDADRAIAERVYGVKGGAWERTHEERWATDFENYAMTGRAPTKGLAAIFEKFKQWLTDIYRSAKGVEIHPEIRDLFDRILGGEEERDAVQPPRGREEVRPTAPGPMAGRQDVGEQVPERARPPADDGAGVPGGATGATGDGPRPTRIIGNKGKAALQPNEHIRFRYELRDASDVITSHDDMLVEDPRFDRGDNLQPRDRERDSSREQIEKIEAAPDPLIMGASPTVQIGAPWLEPAGDRVAVGNGRTIAHRRAYRKGSPAAERYRQMLRDDAENYGFTREDVDALPHPMLVRVPLDPMTPEQLGRFADYGNRTDELRMSPAERSQADARRISPATMSKFEPGDNGDLNVASNDAFRARWVSEVLTQAERAEYLSADGRTLLPGGIQRMQESVVAKGYGSPALVEKLLEGGGGADGLTKTAITGLMRASSTVGKTRMMVEGGEAHKIDFTAPITEALTKYAELRKAGTSIGDFLDQGDMFGDPMSPEARQVLSVLEANKRSAKGLGNYISAVARALENAGDPRTELVGAKPTISDIYGAARIEYEERHGAQGGLFGRAEPVSPSVPTAGGERGDGGFDFGPDEGGSGSGAQGGTGPEGGGGGAPGGGRPGGGEPGGKPRVFAYSSGKGVGRDPYAERTGRQAVPVPTFKRLPRTPPVRPPEGPLEVWKVETLAPNYAKLQDGRAEFLKDIHEFFSATTMDDPAKVVSNIKIAAKGEGAFRVARLDMALRGMERAFDRLKPKDRMKAMEEFAMAGEERRKQATPELQAHWDFYHAMTEAAYADMQRYGHDKFAGYIKDKDYFARQFVNEGEAAAFAHEWYDRKSVDGPKGFLKKRYYELLRDALASGLKLKHDNPARALMEYQAGVQQFLGWQKESSRSIRAGIRKYIPIDREVPHGWDQIHPERGLVYGDPAVMFGEALTKRHLLMEEIAKDLGIKVDRLPGVGGEFGRAEIGGASGARDVAVRAGTPVGILAHEIGHILDSDYKLWDEMMSNKDASPAVRTELRDLAALRYESKAGTVSQGYKDYVHTKEEQIANMLDAYVAEPNLLREVAPVALGEFRSFLLKNPALHKFFEMEPGGKAAGLELEERVHRIPIKGKVVVGRWISPTSVVRLIDRDLSKGFQDKLAYRSLRNLTNVMNRIQLGFSGFHGVFTGLDSVTGNLTLALQEAVAATQPQHAGKGFGVDAAKRIASMAIFPVIPVKRYLEGRKIQRLAEALPHDMAFEQMPQEVRQFIVAGGRFWEDPSHAANQVRAFQKALDRSNPIGGAFHLPGAVIELVSSLIMEKWVPRLKIGMFAQEAAFERKRLGPDATDAEIAYHTRRVQESVENRFGQLAYDNLLWHRAVKDIGQVTVRSLGWGLGSIRDIGGGIFDAGRMSRRAELNRLVEAQKTMQRVVIKNAERDFNAAQQAAQATPTKANIEKAEKAGKALAQAQAAMPSNLNDPVFTRRMAYPIALGISVGMMGALYHWAKRGKLPANAKDFYAIPTGGRNKDGSEERVFLPTYAKEIYAWATHPWETALHKLSPALATGAEIAKNQDYFGTMVREGNLAEQAKDSVEHWIRSLVPFSMRQLMQSQFPGSELGKTEAGLGITKAPASLSRSDAEEKLNEYLHRTSGGIKTKAEAEKSKTRSEIKALIRGGHDEAADAAIEKAIEEHQVSPDEKQGRRALYKAAAKTVLENTLRSMPVDEALEVYRKATPEERQRWADAFRARVFGSASRRPSWWKDRPQEEVEAIQAEAEKLLPPE